MKKNFVKDFGFSALMTKFEVPVETVGYVDTRTFRRQATPHDYIRGNDVNEKLKYADTHTYSIIFIRYY